MADDWIPVRILLADDPAVVAVALSMDVDEDLIVGKLIRLWGWADQHTVDGNARGVTPSWIDRMVRLPGFAAALAERGWLIIEEQGVRIPNFDRWLGNGGKTRVKTNQRVADHRAMKRLCNAPTVTESLPQNRTEENSSNHHTRDAGDGGLGKIAEDVNVGAEVPGAPDAPKPKTHPKFAEVVREFGIATTLGPANRTKLLAMLEVFGVDLVRQGLTEARANNATNPIPYADTICNRLYAEKFQGQRKPRAAPVPSRPSPDRPVYHE